MRIPTSVHNRRGQLEPFFSVLFLCILSYVRVCIIKAPDYITADNAYELVSAVKVTVLVV